MQYQLLPNSTKDAADIFILPFAYEQTVSAKGGTKSAPAAILDATAQIEYFEEDLLWSPMKHLSVCVLPMIDRYEEVMTTLKSCTIDNNKLLITLGGEHSITPMITKQLLHTNSTVIFLDAHADLRSSYKADKYSHATPAYHLLHQGHKIVMAGVRSMFEAEYQTIKKNNNITFFSDRALQNPKTKEEFLKTLATLQGDIYLSIDMDVFNPACVPGVGTPQPGGFDWYEITAILQTLFSNNKINLRGVDIVEMIPDDFSISQTFAAKLLQKIISHWGKSKNFDNKEMAGSQMLVEYE